MPPVPPPLPPPPSLGDAPAPPQLVPRPVVPDDRPHGALLLHLAIHSGGSFKNHWGYFIQSEHNPAFGTIIHVIGDVKNGFEFEVKRNHDFETTSPAPLHIIPLQWIDGKYFNEAMLNNGVQELDDKPVCDFERSVYRVKPPKASLNSATSVSKLTDPVKTNDIQKCTTNSRIHRTLLEQGLIGKIVRLGS
ncbi:hypothetical protein SNK03_004449 [Fusarium graminearum]